MTRKTTIHIVLMFVVTVLALAGCGEKKRAHVPEFKAVSYADSLIFDRGQKQDYQGMLALTDSFEQTLILPDDVDKNKIAAKVENGVLTVMLPKQEETKAKVARQIAIG